MPDQDMIDNLTVPSKPEVVNLDMAPPPSTTPPTPSQSGKGGSSHDTDALSKKLDELAAKLEATTSQSTQVSAVKDAIKTLFTEGADAADALELLGQFGEVDPNVLTQVTASVRQKPDDGKLSPQTQFELRQSEAHLHDYNEQRAATAINRVINDTKLQSLISKRCELDPDAKKEEILAAMRDRINKAVYNSVEAHWGRQPEGTPFNPKWFDQAADYALSELLDVVKLGVGDPSRIGRAPEAAGHDLLQPVPELPRGKDGKIDPNAIREMGPGGFRQYMAARLARAGVSGQPGSRV